MSHRGLKYVKQDEPSFIKKFKQRAGMKPEATISDKVPTMPDDCVEDEKEDEKPVIVVLKKGDLTSEQAESEKSANKEEEDTGKIVFRRPVKRTKETGLSATSKKLKVDLKDKRRKDNKNEKNSKSEKNGKKHKPVSSSLLSFDDNDDA